jgi:hypothetical protein
VGDLDRAPPLGDRAAALKEDEVIRRIGRGTHIAAAWLFVAAVLVQVFLAGLGIFDPRLGFEWHIEFGYTVIGIVTLGVLLSAIAAGLPSREIGLCLLLLVLYVVQTVLPQARASFPVVAALHPVNAIVLFSIGVVIARRSMRPAAS